MTRTLVTNWWLLALGGILEAVYAGMNTFMQRPNGSLAFRTSIHPSTAVNMGLFALGAGLCTIAAALLASGRFTKWLLSMNGIACSALGLLLAFWTGPLRFRTIALLIVTMALSLAFYGLSAVRGLRQHTPERWFSIVGAAVSAGFALAFFALGFGFIKLPPPSPMFTFLWLGAYFAFSAMCMWGLVLGLVLRPRGHSPRFSTS